MAGRLAGYQHRVQTLLEHMTRFWLPLQEAAAGDARARQVERDQLAHLQRHYGDAQAQANALRQQNEELEQQLLEAWRQAQKPSRARRKTKADEQIVRFAHAACLVRSGCRHFPCGSPLSRLHPKPAPCLLQAELESKFASVEAENRALREAAARHSTLLQQSRRYRHVPLIFVCGCAHATCTTCSGPMALQILQDPVHIHGRPARDAP